MYYKLEDLLDQYLKASGLEKEPESLLIPAALGAERIAGHAGSRTTKVYDRRGQKLLLEDMTARNANR